MRDGESYLYSCWKKHKQSPKDRELERIFYYQEIGLGPAQAALRIRRRALYLAQYLIEEELVLDRVHETLHFLEQEGHDYMGPSLEVDNEALALLKKGLHFLIRHKALIKTIKAPLSSRSRHLIALTLGLKKETLIGDRETKVALLSALFTPLRQNIGSCFATSVAILIQNEQPKHVIEDLKELLDRSFLERIIKGKVFRAPMALSIGNGDLKKPAHQYLDPKLLEKITKSEGIAGKKEENLSALLSSNPHMTVEELINKRIGGAQKPDKKPLLRLSPEVFIGNEVIFQRKEEEDFKRNQGVKERWISLYEHPLLKVWEFTLASFSKTQNEEGSTHLLQSVGLDPQEKEGLGAVIQQYLEEKIREEIEKQEAYQKEIEEEYYRLKFLESKFRNASTEREAKWTQTEFQQYSTEYSRKIKERDFHHFKAEKLKELFPFLIQEIQESFSRYFVEVYDPKVSETIPFHFEDTPAGFRLVYTHGRELPALWTFITDEEEFKQALSDFLQAAEWEIKLKEPVLRLEGEFQALFTSLIQWIAEDRFIKGCLKRAKKIEGPSKKMSLPWSYVSGGTLTRLVKNYYALEKEVSLETKEIHTPQELLVFLIESMRSIPPKETKQFQEDSLSGILMFSPTHAFSLRPGFTFFKEAWTEDLYPYSWVRDRLILPQKGYIMGLPLSSDQLTYFLEKNYKLAFKKLYVSDLQNFRNDAIERFNLNSKIFDALLYESFPLHPLRDVESIILDLLEALPLSTQDKDKIASSYRTLSLETPYVTPKELYAILKGLLISHFKRTLFSFCSPQFLLSLLSEKGYRMPSPLLFADSNWAHYSLGFFMNPGTLELEIGCFDPSGYGFPLEEWKSYFSKNGSRWNLLIQKSEYRKE